MAAEIVSWPNLHERYVVVPRIEPRTSWLSVRQPRESKCLEVSTSNRNCIRSSSSLFLKQAHQNFTKTSQWQRRSIKWAPSSEFVSSSIPSWQILTAHAQQFRRARDLVFCLKVPLDSMLVWASSGGSGETARMRRLAWTFAARIGDKYQIRLTRSK